MKIRDADIEELYDSVPYHLKDSAEMPFHFRNLPLDQQVFFRAFCSGVHLDEEKDKTLLQDLEYIKADLEAIIDSVKK